MADAEEPKVEGVLLKRCVKGDTNPAESWTWMVFSDIWWLFSALIWRNIDTSHENSDVKSMLKWIFLGDGILACLSGHGSSWEQIKWSCAVDTCEVLVSKCSLAQRRRINHKTHENIIFEANRFFSSLCQNSSCRLSKCTQSNRSMILGESKKQDTIGSSCHSWKGIIDKVNSHRLPANNQQRPTAL